MNLSFRQKARLRLKRADMFEAEIVRLEDSGEHSEAQKLRTHLLRLLAASSLPKLNDSPERKRYRREFEMLCNADELEKIAERESAPMDIKNRARKMAGEIRAALD